MNIYSIKNEKLGFFNRPIYCESEAEALSMIQNILMSDADRALFNLKDDLALYFLGQIDFQTGVIKPSCLPLDILNNSLNNFAPILICSLEEVFNTIPEDMLKPKLTTADMNRAYEKIKSLEETVAFLSKELKSHKHHRKEIIK